mgnify:FL=1
MSAQAQAPSFRIVEPLAPAVAPPPPSVPREALAGGAAVLERLRAAARRVRCERQMSLRDAEGLVACPGAAAGGAELLVRVLAEVLGRRPVFHAPGSALASFDEAWLCRCRTAQAEGDADTLALLTGRRVHPANRRAFLDVLRSV